MPLKNKIKRILFIVFALGFSVCVFILIVSYYIVPPLSKTTSTIRCLHNRLVEYYEREGKLPFDLSRLPLGERYDNRNHDDWGNPIIYIVSGKYILLLSLGEDGNVSIGKEDIDSYLLFEYKKSWYNAEILHRPDEKMLEILNPYLRDREKEQIFKALQNKKPIESNSQRE